MCKKGQPPKFNGFDSKAEAEFVETTESLNLDKQIESDRMNIVDIISGKKNILKAGDNE